MIDPVTLSDEELAFFRLTCDLFPIHESPLRFLSDQDREPIDVEGIYGRLEERGLLNAAGSGASDALLARLLPVTECGARVILRMGSDGRGGTRTFYVADGTSVEYEREDDLHHFGAPHPEEDLVRTIAAGFRTVEQIRARPLAMSAGDYLVFAVFARDLRGKPAAEPVDDDAPMSLDEVLSYFDEPEAPGTPQSDASWQSSVDTLLRDGALVETGDGYSLHPSLHAVAREIVADRQHSIVRLDYLDEHWLVREINLYPTDDTVYRLGSRADGSVVIEELSTDALREALHDVVATLPNLVDADVPVLQHTPPVARV